MADNGISPFDVTKYTSPATASLMGLLSGMFSDKLFTLLGELVDALIERITPNKKHVGSTAEDALIRSRHAEADASTVPAAESHPDGDIHATAETSA